MAYFSRLIFAFVLLGVTPAFAAFSGIIYQSPAAYTNPSSSFTASDALAACNKYGATISRTFTTTSDVNQATGTCYTSGGQGLANWSKSVSCGTGATLSGSTCTCNSGYQQVGSSCVPDVDDCSGKFGTAWPAPSPTGAWNSLTRKAYTFCPNTGGTTTCVVIGTSISTGPDGNNFIAGPWKYTGGLCAQAGLGTGAESQPLTPCQSGYCPGVINGTATCVKCASVTEATKTDSTTTGTTTPPGGGTPTSTSSSSSTSSETTCAGASCTTTITKTSTNPDGSTSSAQTSTSEAKTDYCKDNPRAAACRDGGGTWGGSCGSFSCDGDAVTCAIAQASWKSACALDIEPTDSKVQAGNTALSGGDRPAGHPGNNPSSSVFSANLDQTNPYGSTCPADISLNVMGNVVSIPLSSACDTFRLMGQVAVAFTLLAAAFVIFGGVKG